MAHSSRTRVQRPTSVKTLMRDGAHGDKQSESSFGRILAHAGALSRLDEKLTSILDPGLARYCQVAEFRDLCLILVCSNASFATRIRMILQQILESFREDGVSGISQIEVRVAPVNRPQPEVRKRRTLSSAALQSLGRFASDSGDAEIQAIFDRINARRNR